MEQDTMNDLLDLKQWKRALNRTMYRSLALLKIITSRYALGHYC